MAGVLALAGCVTTGTPTTTPGATVTPAGTSIRPGSEGPSSTPAASVVSPSAAVSPTSGPTPSSASVGPSTTAPTVTAPPTTSATGSAAPPRTTTATTAAPPATCVVPAALRGLDVERISGTRKVIALTFDAGGAPDGGERILATLAAENVPATFFLTGNFVQQNPGLSRRIAAAYPVGNHTQTHPDLTTLSDAAVRSELDRARAAIIAATGQDPRPYFRFPFGEVDRRTITIVNDACYVPFRWTIDTLGWQGTSGGMSADKVYQRVVDRASAGGIVLMHIGSNPTDRTTLDADALPRIIAELRARGYVFVTLEAVLPAAP